MANEIADLVKFKQDINDLVDRCIEFVKEERKNKDNSDMMRLITQVMTYYERMKVVYSNVQSEDDDDDALISEDSDTDFTNIMADRVYCNPHNINDDDARTFRQENEMRRKLLGLNYDGYNEFDRTDDTSVDPTIYDDTNSTTWGQSPTDHVPDEISEEEEQNLDACERGERSANENFVMNNQKKTLKDFVEETDIELINENIDYEEPPIV